LKVLKELGSLQDLVRDFGPVASYLSAAEAVMPPGHDWLDRVQAIREEVLADLSEPAKRASALFRRQSLRKLTDLKKAYVREYLDLHTRSRLGANEDRRKRMLMGDDRFKALSRLSTIDLMPRQQLIELQNSLTGLKTCFALTEQELDASPVCPHCSFRPAAEDASASAAAVLDHLDRQLDELVSNWTEALLSNLEDPTTRSNLNLLRPEQRKAVENFLKERTLPDELSDDFIEALHELLSGLVPISVKTEDLRAALLKGGTPATPTEMKKRFEEYVDQLTKGHEPNRVRIVLE